MKIIFNTHHIIILIVISSLYFTPSLAETTVDIQTPPSAEEINKSQQKLQLKTETIYQGSFLPGVRLCEQSEVDYRGDFRKVNCQDDEIINSVSVRKADIYNTSPDIIVDDRIKPNGNIFRLDFRRKTTTVENTPEN